MVRNRSYPVSFTKKQRFWMAGFCRQSSR